ncbi:MAG: polysaccharide biosynthesis C-terminal domain-containing protein, partial [Saprospiraceae bacterium]
FAGAFYRFSPYYEKYAQKEKSDLFQLYLLIIHIGIGIVFVLSFAFRHRITGQFEVKSPLFATYYPTVFIFSYLFIIYNTLELYLFTKGQAIAQSFAREIIIRVIILLFSLCTLYFLSVNQYIYLYSIHYIIPIGFLLWVIHKRFPIHLGVPFSKVTSRLWPHMKKMASWGIVQTIVSTGVPVVDTLVIGSFIGLKQVAEYQIMTYVSTLIHVPLRATIGVLGAKISEQWMNYDLKGIQNTYQRTSMSYLTFALFASGMVIANIDLIQKLTGKNIDLNFSIIAVLLFARVLELSTGLSNLVIAYSKKWRYENIISIANIIVAVPLNLIMIRKFGMLGVAYSTLILYVITYSFRIILLNILYGLFPFSKSSFQLILGFIILVSIMWWGCSHTDSLFLKLIFSILFGGIYLLFALKMKFSEDLNLAFDHLIKRAMSFLKPIL